MERTFAILRAVANHGRSAGVSDVARSTGLAKSTVSRMLVALEAQGAVDRLDPSGRYVIGSGLARLTANAPMAGLLRDIARPEMVELSALSGEACALVVPDGREVLYLDCEQADTSVVVQDWTGERFPPHVVAGGLAIQSRWSAEQVRDYAATGLERYTPSTITDLRTLNSRLGAVRSGGHAWTMGEFDEHINGLAAPVIDPKGRSVAALTLYGPDFRFPGPDSDQIAAALHDAVARVSAALT